MKSICLAALAVWVASCSEAPPPGDPALAIELRWIKSYPQERRAHVETGLLWTLSFLGATLPREAQDLLSWRGDVVTLRLDRAGVEPSALPHWQRLLDAMKSSEEYALMGAIDIGRFVALTLCSSHHYYALTGAATRYEEARGRYAFDPQLVALVESAVAHGDRLLEISIGTAIQELAFVGHEGTGSIGGGSFREEEHELLDVMPNGQLRFALYDSGGDLKPAATSALTLAGKPSKCLWCHESRLLRPFRGRTSVTGYHSPSAFEEHVTVSMARLRGARAQLSPNKIDFSREQDHTYAELLYLAFYEPSADRLAREWDTPIERVRQALSQLPTHAHDEFPFLGDRLYRRSQVDALAPYAVIEVPTDPRELSTYEPNLLR